MLFLFVSLAAATDLCLPDVHSTFVHIYHDTTHREHDSHHPEEYRESDHMHLWFDKPAGKMLTHTFQDEHHAHDPHRPPVRGVLTDGAKGLRWQWDWDQESKTVRNCILAKTTRPFATICIVHMANLTRSGTLGEDFAVDNYYSRYENKTSGVIESVDTLVEANTTNLPVQQKTRGQRQTGGLFDTWFDSSDWINFSTLPIEPTVFAVPSECPM